jgi:hypothetical protein
MSTNRDLTMHLELRGLLEMILEIRPEVWTNKRHSIRHKDSLRSVWSRISDLVMRVNTLEARMDAFIERFEQRIPEHVVPPATSTSSVKAPAPPLSVKAPPLSNAPTAAPPLAMELPPAPRPPAFAGVPDPPKAPPKAPAMVKAKPPPPAIPKRPPPRLPGDPAPASIACSSTGATPHVFSPRIGTRGSTGSS